MDSLYTGNVRITKDPYMINLTSLINMCDGRMNSKRNLYTRCYTIVLDLEYVINPIEEISARQADMSHNILLFIQNSYVKARAIPTYKT